jgi:speckle-type POZ protein
LDDLDEVESQEIVKHLLVAAGRNAMERMKLMCESILSKRIDVHSVATTLALAD